MLSIAHIIKRVHSTDVFLSCVACVPPKVQTKSSVHVLKGQTHSLELYIRDVLVCTHQICGPDFAAYKDVPDYIPQLLVVGTPVTGKSLNQENIFLFRLVCTYVERTACSCTCRSKSKYVANVHIESRVTLVPY